MAGQGLAMVCVVNRLVLSRFFIALVMMMCIYRGGEH